MKSLAEYAFEIERICFLAEQAEEGMTDAMVKKLSDLQGSVSNKTDNWIGYLDSLKGRIADLEEKTHRFSKALQVTKNLEKRLKSHLVHIIENTPTVTYTGSVGTLKIQKSPPTLQTDMVEFSINIKHVHHMMCPKDANDYLELKEYWVIKKDSLKNDLKVGKDISFAKLEQKNHLRIKA